MAVEDSSVATQIGRIALREKMLAQAREALIAGHYSAVRDGVLESTASLDSPVIKEEIALLIFGIRAAVRTEPPDPEAVRVLTHRYWDAKEKFIEQLGVTAEQAESLSIRMLDIFDEPADTRT